MEQSKILRSIDPSSKFQVSTGIQCDNQISYSNHHLLERSRTLKRKNHGTVRVDTFSGAGSSLSNYWFLRKSKRECVPTRLGCLSLRLIGDCDLEFECCHWAHGMEACVEVIAPAFLFRFGGCTEANRVCSY